MHPHTQTHSISCIMTRNPDLAGPALGSAQASRFAGPGPSLPPPTSNPFPFSGPTTISALRGGREDEGEIEKGGRASEREKKQSVERFGAKERKPDRHSVRHTDGARGGGV